jgi:hypothetical protein
VGDAEYYRLKKEMAREQQKAKDNDENAAGNFAAAASSTMVPGF